MKWVGLIIILGAILPLSAWVRRHPHHAPKLWAFTGFLPFIVVDLHLLMASVSWPDWPGYMKGVEFSVLDGLALALYLSLSCVPRPLPFRLSMGLYFLAVLLSVFQAQVPAAALFYSWQLARMFLIYATVTSGVFADPRVAPALIKGMAAGLIIEAGLAVWQRFGLGILQPYGTFSGQNFLGVTSHFVIFPFFALLLTKRSGWLPFAVVLAGVVVEVLTTSRATIGLASLGFVALLIISSARQLTSWKMLIFVIGTIVAVIVVPLVLSSFDQRKVVNNERESDQFRDAASQAAAMISSDHPLGIGANHFLRSANAHGYYERAGVSPNSRSFFVHNVYWLVASETGYFGLISFVFLLLQPVTVAFRCGWRHRGDRRGDLLLGLGVGLLIVYIHSFYEWIFVLSESQYLFALNVGLIAGLSHRLGYWRRAKPTRFKSGRLYHAGHKAGSIVVAPTDPAAQEMERLIRALK
jgi:O-antigen ligase